MGTGPQPGGSGMAGNPKLKFKTQKCAIQHFKDLHLLRKNLVAKSGAKLRTFSVSAKKIRVFLCVILQITENQQDENMVFFTKKVPDARFFPIPHGKGMVFRVFSHKKTHGKPDGQRTEAHAATAWQNTRPARQGVRTVVRQWNRLQQWEFGILSRAPLSRCLKIYPFKIYRLLPIHIFS